VAVATAVVLTGALLAGMGGAVIEFEHVRVGDGRAVGTALFTAWVLPFEVLSVLLLAALIGAIVLSRGRGREDGR
jgi:NADH-quinone oxidoreductase subunit J